MAISDLHPPTTEVRRPARHRIASVALGVVFGLVAYYAIAAVSTAPSSGGFFISPLMLVLIGVVAAAAVLVADQWPTLGLTAGIVILAIVAYAVFQHVTWTSNDAGSLNPGALLGVGAATGYPMMLGAAMIAASARKLVKKPVD
ncbi:MULTISPECIES: hypothetical protein [unclassified Curtobacterium]|uniref:hypothetical protein n=1 Tax=unclassified Curtobacterium TaxID=257496 RepID=UPI0011B3A823|nr:MULTISPECIES: hypothetical protein [unclassified Curtobacterium]WIB71893.1 hypothetical protein DEI85_05670 [Curtobacterium sp. MCBD17_026]